MYLGKKVKTMKKLLLMLILIPSITWSQAENKEDVWKPVRFLAGSWDGHETGVAGIGKGGRTYEYILKDNFLQVKNKSVFKPQEKNPKGEVHEDMGFFSFDKSRKKLVL